jgi:hypothetical protein
MIPESSAIYQIIEDGDLEGLQRLIKDGKASFWDCDPDGRSLITVRPISVLNPH